MAHRSWCAEHGGPPSNERLEFLGDAVLGWSIADIVFNAFPNHSEGQLTDLRKSVVNATALAEVARSLDLGRHVLLGRGELHAGGADKTSILSDAIEAVIGAVYLDGGMTVAHALIHRLFSRLLAGQATHPGHQDHKTRLQELLARTERLATYTIESSGPDHARTFAASVVVDGEVQGRGTGPSKKQAEQAAAHDALVSGWDDDA